MADHDERQAALRRVAEYVEQTRERLADGRANLDRMRSSVRETKEHMSSMAAWIDETERQLRAARGEVRAKDERAA